MAKRERKTEGEIKTKESFLTSQNTDVAPYISKPVQILIKPKLYTSPEAMYRVMEDYFNSCDMDDRKYTIEGLTLHLGFTSTETLRVYGTAEGYEAFHELVRSAKLKVQEQRVQDMQGGKLNVLAGIFLLSNCHDYKRDPDKYSKELIKSAAGAIEVNYFEPTQDEETTDEPEADTETGSEL